MSNEDKINLFIKKAQDYQKKDDYYRAYSNYKKAFKLSNNIKILFIMIDLVFHSQKSGLLINQNLKYNLLRNLIKYGFKCDASQKFFNQLCFYKLKLYREFRKFEKFKTYLESNKLLLSKDFLIHQENLHYLLEVNNFEEAELALDNLPFDKSEIYSLLKIFFLDKNSYTKILNTENIELNSNQSKVKCIKTKYDYTVLTSGNYNIFLYEMMNFFISLNKNSSNFLLVIYIHDANKTQKEHIQFAINNLDIANYIIIFDDVVLNNLSNIQIKSFYTANRYIISNYLLNEFNKPVFVFDADTIIYRDLLEYVKVNKKNDFCLSIKRNLRYVWTFFSAPHTIFYPTKKSMDYLNFFEKYIYYCIKNNLIRWHIDQVALYTSYVMLERFQGKMKIFNNSEQYSHKDRGKYFRHMRHIYLLN